MALNFRAASPVNTLQNMLLKEALEFGKMCCGTVWSRFARDSHFGMNYWLQYKNLKTHEF